MVRGMDPSFPRGPCPEAGAHAAPRPLRAPRRPHHLGLVYAAYYGALGALAPFLPLFYRAHGMDGLQIGALAAVAPALALVCQPLWAGLADRRGQRRTLLLTLLAGSGITSLLFLLARNFAAFLLCAAAMSVFSTSVGPVADSLTILHLGVARERYARIRLWGAAAFALATVSVGAVLGRDGLALIFPVYAVGLALALVLVAGGPSGSAPAAQRRRPWDALPELWRTPAYRAFVGVACLLQLASSANNAFLSVYLHTLGSSARVVGLAWAVAAASEVPVMALVPHVVSRLGPRRVLTAALLVYAARYALFSAFAARGAGWILGLQLLQGLSFGLFYTTAVPYVSRLAPPHLQTSGQAVYAAATQGATAIVSALLAGLAFDALGPRAVYEGAAVAAALAALALGRSGLPLAPGREAAPASGASIKF